MPITDAWVETVYRCATSQMPWAEALRPIVKETNSFCMGAVNHTVMPLSAIIPINIDGPPNLAEFYEQTFVHENPIIDKLSSLTPGNMVTGFTKPGEATTPMSKFFTEYLAPQNIGDALWISLARRPGDFFMLAAPRMSHLGPYTQADIDNLQPYLPHLVRAFDIWLKLNLQQAENQWISAAMDQVSNGMITLGPHRTILYANRAAEKFLESIKVAQRKMLKLHFADAVLDLQFQAILDGLPQSAGPHSDNILILRRGSAQAPLLLRFEPSGFEQTEGVLPKPVAVIHIIDPDARVFKGLAAFARSFNLTTAETRILEQLVQTGSIVEASISIGVEQSTARTHVKSIYSKTRVNTLGLLLIKVFKATLV